MLELEAISVWLGEHSSWLLPIIALIAFIESFAIAGIIVPGVAILFSAAALASISNIALMHVLIAAFIGAVAGDVSSFFLGRWFQEHLRDSWAFKKYPSAISKGEAFFNKYGTISVVIGRFVGPLRPVLPLTAGMLGMPPTKFIGINVLSALAWAPFYILPGYIGGSLTQLDIIQNEIGNVTWLILLFSAAVIPWLILIRKRNIQIKLVLWSALASLTLFLLLCIVLKMGLLERLDVWAFSHAISWRNPFIDHVLVYITLLGDEWLLIVLFTLVVAQLAIHKRFDWAITFAATGLATSALTHALKSNFDLARPDYIAGHITSAAFPSGHTSGSWVLLGLLSALWIRERSNFHKRFLSTALVVAVMIAASRLLLGVHWVSDIAGGMLVASFLVAVGCWLQSNLAKTLKTEPLNSAFWRRIIFSVCATALLYQGLFFDRILPLYQASF